MTKQTKPEAPKCDEYHHDTDETEVVGDCRRCGHSVLYHLPLVGCTKLCGCDEFS